jgi:murein DD-endopeptidase MepM/ murein hydrolase activator NlpD
LRRKTNLRFLAISFLVLLTIAVASCSGSQGNGDNGDGVTIVPITPSPVPTTPAGSPAPTATSVPPNGGAQLSGFVYPIPGGCLPQGSQLMPNAPRPYRNGVHEGVDFYDSDNCTSITRGTPVVAAKAGTVTRADLDYRDLTLAEMNAFLANPNTEQALDAFRGRQVWIDHGDGVVTRYAHLHDIAAGITVGTRVNAGQLIAFVGESGTPDSLTSPGTEYHLHFEVWVGNTFLGKDLPAAEVRRLYLQLFSP